MVLGLLGIWLSLPAMSARADDPPARWDFSDPEGPAELRGYQPREAFSFTVPPGWEITTDPTLTVSYVASPQVDATAAMTVELNGTPVSVIPVSAGAHSHDVNLPAGLVVSGENELALEAILPLVEDLECVDPSHPARWLVLAGDNSLVVDAVPAAELHIRDYPEVLAPLGNTEDHTITFVVPPNPGRDELSALASVAFATARIGVDAEWRVRSSETDAQPAEGETVVVIGTPAGDALPGDAAGSASVSRTPSGDVELVLAAGPEGSLAAVADALGDTRTLFPLSGGVVTITSAAPRTAEEPSSDFTLTDLGFGPRTVRGSGERSLIYAFDVPAAWSQEGSYVTADVIADPGRVAVAINGTDVSRQVVDQRGGLVDADLIEIDPRHMRPGRNYIRFTFDLEEDFSCRPGSGGPAGTVTGETRLRMVHGADGARLDVGDFDEMFAAEPDMTNLVIVLPDEPTLEDLADLLHVVRTVSRSSSRFAPRAMTTAELTELDLVSHLVILGDQSRQTLVGALDGHLPLALAADGSVLDGARMEISGLPASPGVIEVLENPWNPVRRIVVVTGASAASYDAAMLALTADGGHQELRGVAALVGRVADGAPIEVISLMPDDPAIRPGSSDFVSRTPVAVRVALGALLVVAVAMASTFFRRHPLRRPRRRRTDQPAEH